MKNNFAFYSLIAIISPFLAVSAASSFSPADHYLISCGSSDSSITDLYHRRFVGDVFDSDTGTSLSSSTGTFLLTNTSPDAPPLYHTARAFNRPSKYVFRIKDEGAHHLVRLHFHRFVSSSSLGGDFPARFHVLANGFLLLHDFDVNELQEDLVIKEFVLRVDSDKLQITFVPAKKSGFGYVNAIEVISAPIDMISDLALYEGSDRTVKIDGVLKNGFETVYRVSVGGPIVTPFNDSLWRTWVSDDQYLSSSEGSSRIHFGGRINYQTGGASREVGPDNVYSSARVIKSLDDSIPRYNMTWRFIGIEEYSYLVRLHFCDISSIALNMIYFNVYLNGNLAIENLDLSAQTGLLASPFYADFVVHGGVSGDLTVSVGASNLSLPRATDAILNGIEVFKMNNRMNSFDGEICAESIMKRWRSGSSGLFFPLLAAVFLLLAASAVVVQRRRTGAMESQGFSRLPVDASEINVKYGNQMSSAKL